MKFREFSNLQQSVKVFLNTKKLDSSKKNWIELYSLFKSKNL